MLLLTFVCGTAGAQRPTDFGQSTRSGPPQQQQQTADEGPDTTVYNYILLDDIYRVKVMDDTLGDIGFLHRNPLYRDGAEMVNAGNLGSATYPLIYRPEIFTTFNTGYDQYDCFRLGYDNFRFYEQNRPISDLWFSQLGNQDNINVGAEFSRNFKNGLSFSINYKRISQKGFYAGQDTKTTAFGSALRYRSKSGRYNGFLLFAHNANEEGHLGSIVNVSDLNSQFKRNIEVVLKEAGTRQQVRDFAFIQYLQLNKSKSSPWKLYLKNDLVYRPSYYRYYDNSISDRNDSLYYAGIAVEERGIRRYVVVNRLTEGIYIHGEKKGGLHGRLGLVYDHFNIKNDSNRQARNDLTGVMTATIPVFRALQLNTSAKLGLAQNFGNFDLKGDLTVKAGRSMSVTTSLRLFRTEPSYNSRTLSINGALAFDTTFTKPFGSVLEASLNIPKLNLTASLAQSVVNNPLYWDTLGLPRQTAEVYSATHVRIKNRLRVWKIHFDNQVNFQVLSSGIYPMPSFYSTHQLYYSGKWFRRVLDISIGLDGRMIADYKGPSFQPLFGEFHQSNTTLPFIPFVNLFITAKVGSFRAMFVMENFGQFFDNRYNFDVVGNPLFDPTLRFGIQWLLKD